MFARVCLRKLRVYRVLTVHLLVVAATSACSCERNWSAYDNIHNKKRNRLAAARAEKLVFVFSNLRMLRKLAQLDYEEQCLSWEDEEESREGNVLL